MPTATETATINEAATKRIADMVDSIALLNPASMPLTALINNLEKVDQDYEDAKALIQEVNEAYGGD